MAIHAGGEILNSQQMGQVQMLMFMMMVMIMVMIIIIIIIIAHYCVCGVSFSTDHAMIFSHEVMTIIRHNEIRDLTTNWMNEVSAETEKEPQFQPLSGENILPQTNKKKPGWISRQKAFGVDSKAHFLMEGISLLEMASVRFLKITEEDIKSFSDKPENATTEKKTLYDVKTFSEFLANEEELREIEQIVQITGHKNVNSLNNYSVISDKKQQQISAILSGATEGNENSLATPTQTFTIDKVTATACKIIFA